MARLRTWALGALATTLVVVSVPPSANAASGTFFYTRADNGMETTLNIPTPNGACLAISGGARNAHNDTDTDASMYTNSNCTVFAGFVGSRNFETFSAPFPTFVKFG
ncbi:hypothetical protein [Nonomuraea candida]|uniref:hypothetical protein n=1 Tax=Nonomuraea candida TaxID=359159 RepID=UPI0005B97B6B|nr:hypothetical protein [Nonomuraea candida]